MCVCACVHVCVCVCVCVCLCAPSSLRWPFAYRIGDSGLFLHVDAQTLAHGATKAIAFVPLCLCNRFTAAVLFPGKFCFFTNTLCILPTRPFAHTAFCLDSVLDVCPLAPSPYRTLTCLF